MKRLLIVLVLFCLIIGCSTKNEYQKTNNQASVKPVGVAWYLEPKYLKEQEEIAACPVKLKELVLSALNYRSVWFKNADKKTDLFNPASDFVIYIEKYKHCSSPFNKELITIVDILSKLAKIESDCRANYDCKNYTEIVEKLKKQQSEFDSKYNVEFAEYKNKYNKQKQECKGQWNKNLNKTKISFAAELIYERVLEIQEVLYRISESQNKYLICKDEQKRDPVYHDCSSLIPDDKYTPKDIARLKKSFVFWSVKYQNAKNKYRKESGKEYEYKDEYSCTDFDVCEKNYEHLINVRENVFVDDCISVTAPVKTIVEIPEPHDNDFGTLDYELSKAVKTIQNLLESPIINNSFNTTNHSAITFTTEKQKDELTKKEPIVEKEFKPFLDCFLGVGMGFYTEGVYKNLLGIDYSDVNYEVTSNGINGTGFFRLGGNINGFVFGAGVLGHSFKAASLNVNGLVTNTQNLKLKLIDYHGFVGYYPDVSGGFNSSLSVGYGNLFASTDKVPTYNTGMSGFILGFGVGYSVVGKSGFGINPSIFVSGAVLSDSKNVPSTFLSPVFGISFYGPIENR
jgi:hypothetical protein